MGFSPGDFTCSIQGRLHWELKDRGIVLWTDNELKAILDLNFDEARQCTNQLNLLMHMYDGE